MAKGVEILSRINQPSADINFDWSDSIPIEVDGIKMNVYYSKKLKDYYVTIDNLGKDLFGMNSVSVTLFNHDDRDGSMKLLYPDIVMTSFKVGDNKSKRVYLVSTEALKKMCFYYTSILKDYADKKTAMYNAMVGLQKQSKVSQTNLTSLPSVKPVAAPVRTTKVEVTIEPVEPVKNVYIPNIVQPMPVTEEEQESLSKAIHVEDVQEYVQNNINDEIVDPILRILQIHGEHLKHETELQHIIAEHEAAIILLKEENLALRNVSVSPNIPEQEVYRNIFDEISKLHLFQDWEAMERILYNAVETWCNLQTKQPNQGNPTMGDRWNMILNQFKIRNGGKGVYPPKGVAIYVHLIEHNYAAPLYAAFVEVSQQDNTLEYLFWAVEKYFKVERNTAIFYINQILKGESISIPYE